MLGRLLQAFLNFMAIWIPTGILLSLVAYVLMAIIGNISPYDLGVGVFAVQAAPVIGFVMALPQTFLILLLQNKRKAVQAN